MMSRREYIVIGCGTLALLFIALFPPLIAGGHGFLFTTPSGGIATGHLLAQSVGIVAIILSLTLAFRLVPRHNVRLLTTAVAFAALGVVCLLPLFGLSPLLRDAVGGSLSLFADVTVVVLFSAAAFLTFAAFRPRRGQPHT